MNQIVIRADLGKDKISRHIYGHFAEHLGRCIYEGFWVGETSPIPNTRGIRRDVVEALRRIRVPVLRWPGGCFADTYHWLDGIGPREKRPVTVNSWWGGVAENNHFGTHEFMDLCEQLGCEAYVCGNVGSGSVHEMQQWVEYLNSDRGRMADRRRENGREEPWGVKFWGVGNESWGCGGRMRPDYYADLLRQYATYLHDLGETKLYKIACGPSADDYAWTEVLMQATKGLPASTDSQEPFIAGLSLHYYTIVGTWDNKGSATGFQEDEWFQAFKSALRMEELIERHSAIMDRYDPDKRVGLIVDEWGTWWAAQPGTNRHFLYQQNTLRDALVAGLTLNILNQKCERVRMANIAQTANVLQAMVLTQDEKLILTPTYHVFEMYADHQDATLLPLQLRCEEYTYEGESLPSVSASASRSQDGSIHLTLCNLYPQRALEVSCLVQGMSVSHIAGRVLTGEVIDAHNTFDHPESVSPVPFSAFRLTDNNRVLVELPARAVVALKIESGPGLPASSTRSG